MKLPALLARFAPTASFDHRTLSAGAFAALSLATIAAIQLFGDPGAARPRRIIVLNAAVGTPAFHAPLSQVVIDPSSIEDAGGYDTASDTSIEAALGTQAAAALAKAPIAKLAAPGPKGVLPIIAADGTTPAGAYKRPFTGDAAKPRVGIIVGGLGFNASVTQSAIDELPADVTLSFVPYADNLQNWIDQARAKGHEVLIELPMEPFDIEANDTGPQTLLASGPPKDNQAKLLNLLSRGAGYFGVSNYQGAKFAMSSAASAPIVNALKSRGLDFIANGISPRAALSTEAVKQNLPFAAADRVLDARRDADAINDQLLGLENAAQQNGAALGAGFAFPVTIAQVKAWATALADRGIVLAPASAIVDARNPKH